MILIVAVMMLVLCGCEKPGFDRYACLDISYASDETSLTDNSNGTLKGVRITNNRKDAKEILDMIYDYLAAQGIEKNIKAIYDIQAGMAGNFSSVTPVKVVFEDENVEPVYILLFTDFRKYTAGKSIMGDVREKDVINNQYYVKFNEVISTYYDQIKARLGFLNKGAEAQIMFPIEEVRDVTFKEPDKTMEMLRGDTYAAYIRFMLGSWIVDPEGISINGEYYQKLISDDIKSTEDLVTKHLMKYFTPGVSQDIRAAFSDMFTGEYPVYVDYNGSVYVAPIGMGGPEGLESLEIKSVGEKGDLLFMILEKVMVELDDDWNPIDGSQQRYEYLWIFEKDASGEWKCGEFADPVYEMFTSIPVTE